MWTGLTQKNEKSVNSNMCCWVSTKSVGFWSLLLCPQCVSFCEAVVCTWSGLSLQSSLQLPMSWFPVLQQTPLCSEWLWPTHRKHWNEAQQQLLISFNYQCYIAVYCCFIILIMKLGQSLFHCWTYYKSVSIQTLDHFLKCMSGKYLVLTQWQPPRRHAFE